MQRQSLAQPFVKFTAWGEADWCDQIYHAALIQRLEGPGDLQTGLFDLRKLTGLPQELTRLLSPAEVQSSARIVADRSQCRFCLRKGLTRLVLGRFLGLPPAKVRYFYDDHGKPWLATPPTGHWEFNLSHSGDYLLIGLGHSGKVGVDIERIKLQRNIDSIAPSVFSPEEWEIYHRQGSAARLPFFYRTWVIKEAIGKALGLGLASGFCDFTAATGSGAESGEYCIQVPAFQSWFRVRAVAAGDYVLAIAVRENGVYGNRQATGNESPTDNFEGGSDFAGHPGKNKY